jgi:FkbM family methyltransferase
MLRQLLSSLLRFLPEQTTIPILSGPLRGNWWILSSGAHTYWRGAYETELSRKIEVAVKPGMTCYDCGANAGYFTLLLSQLVGPSGHVFSFEPLPANVRYIRRHVRLNRCTNVTVVEGALSDSDGKVSFACDPYMGRISAEGEIQVDCRRIDSIGLPPPDVVKIDVEGAEERLVDGAGEVFRRHRPTIFMSLHIPLPSAQLLADRIESMGYSVTFSKHTYDLTAVRTQ